MTDITDMKEMLATEYKTKLTKALHKLELENIDLNTIIQTMKKIKITKKTSVKRPLTAYNLFMQVSLKQVKIDYPNITQQDVMTETARLWNIHKKNDKSS
jgi:hypothetical protein